MPIPADLELDRITGATTVDQIHWFDEIDSTNNAALARVESARVESAGGGVELFLSDRQLAGRGRSGAEWWSGPGALTFSLLVDRPPLPPHATPLASLAVGLGVCRAVEPFLPSSQVRVKWPNDVFVDGRKACGVLIEAPATAPRLVVGIGLNVNNVVADAPPELQLTATSLRDALGRPDGQPLDRTAVLMACVERVLAELAGLASAPHRLAEALAPRSLLTGKQVRIETPGSVTAGTCRGIAADGALIVESDGQRKACYGGVVTRFE